MDELSYISQDASLPVTIPPVPLTYGFDSLWQRCPICHLDLKQLTYCHLKLTLAQAIAPVGVKAVKDPVTAHLQGHSSCSTF
eukprot:4379877-Amphidinium_carterae.2